MTHRRIRVYICGPYSRPDPCINTHQAMKVWDDLTDMGFAAFCPHLSHFQHTMTPRPYEEWLRIDLEWVRACDAVYRFPGESAGADKEVIFARELGIPVFFSVRALAAWAGVNRAA